MSSRWGRVPRNDEAEKNINRDGGGEETGSKNKEGIRPLTGQHSRVQERGAGERERG